MGPGELTCAEPRSGGWVFFVYIKKRKYLSPLVMEDFATPLSHLAEIAQEVQQLWKRKGNVGAHKTHFSRETLLPIQMTLIE